MKLQVGDKVYIKSKSKGKSLRDFSENWDEYYLIHEKNLLKTEYTIESINYNNRCYVIWGDWFTEDDLSPVNQTMQQLKLF